MDAMAPVRHHSGMDFYRYRVAGWMVMLALLLAAAGPLHAQRVEGERPGARGVYQAEVPVHSQGEADRERGYARALAQVLGKLTGDRRAAEHPGVATALARAGDYVEGFDYRQDEGVSATTGAPTYGTTLIVRFDEDRVDGLAAALGLPVWPTPRPKPVLWLAIDDGSGPRLVGLPQAEAARSLLDQAIERGYRLGLPSGSAAEQAAVGAIWRGDVGAVARISSRYNPPMQLLGKLRRGGAGWVADWIFVDRGQVLKRWSSENRSARQAMAAGADGAADALAARYARAPEPLGEPGRYLVRFTGLDDAGDYMRLSAWLQGQSVVQDIVPRRASAGMAEFELQLATGLPGLRLVLDDELLVPAGEGEPPTFRVR